MADQPMLMQMQQGQPPMQMQPGQPQWGGPPPVLQQPGQVTTVVVQQQMAKPKSWSQGLFGCFDDFKICACVTFCPPCAACQLSQDIGENMCLGCCVPNYLTAVRVKVRTQLGIQGSICDDCCMSVCCSWCAMCQVWREVKLAKERGDLP